MQIIETLWLIFLGIGLCCLITFLGIVLFSIITQPFYAKKEEEKKARQLKEFGENISKLASEVAEIMKEANESDKKATKTTKKATKKTKKKEEK